MFNKEQRLKIRQRNRDHSFFWWKLSDYSYHQQEYGPYGKLITKELQIENHWELRALKYFIVVVP